MNEDPKCPKCSYEYTYENGEMRVCPECSYEWSPAAERSTAPTQEESGALVVKDAHGAILSDGDSVTMIKDLKVKGSTTGLKVGTKIKNIRLTEGDHNIDCKVEGIGAMKLKSEYVKKA